MNKSALQNLHKFNYQTFSQRLEEIKTQKKSIIIFGLSKYIKEHLPLLQEHGISISCICDNNQDLQKTEYLGIPIYSFEEARKTQTNPYFLIVNVPEVQEQVESFGYEYIQDYCFFFSFKLYLAEYKDTESAELKLHYKALFSRENAKKYKCPESPLCYVDVIDIYLTDRCTLNCQNCCNLIPYFQDAKDYTYETIIKEIDDVCNTFDHIYDLHLLGGELFVHKDAYKIINYATTKENVSYVSVYSNATIPLKEEELPLFNKDKVTFSLTKYPGYSRHVEQNKALLDQYNIMASSKEDSVWFDCIGFEYQNYSPEDLQKIYDTCCTKDARAYVDGKIFFCTYLASLYKLKAIPVAAIEMIDCNGYTDSDLLKKDIIKYLYDRTVLSTCQYCKGRSDEVCPSIPAAIQMKGKISYEKYS